MGRMGFATLCFFLFVAFFEVLFFCFGQLLLVLGGCARMSYTPRVPLKRGDLEASLLLLMSCLVCYNSPLERGLRGVLR